MEIDQTYLNSLNKINNVSQKLELSFYHKCKPYLIKYTINDNFIEFSWQNRDITTNEFKLFGILEKNAFNYNHFDLFSSDLKQSLPFQILVLQKLQANNVQAVDIKFQHQVQNLDPNLFNILFQSYQVNTVILTASRDGYVYWSTLNDEKLNDTALDLSKRLILNTPSSIIFIDCFSFKNELNIFETTVSKTKSNKFKILENCLFVVTKSGKIYLYAYANGEFIYKICILSHLIEFCIKHTIFNTNNEATDYLIYSTFSGEIYAIQLSSCFKSTNLKAIQIKTFCSIEKLYKGKSFL